MERPSPTANRDGPISAAETAVSASGGDASNLKSLQDQSVQKQAGESDSIGFEHHKDGFGFGRHPSKLLRPNNVETPQDHEGELFEPSAFEQDAADVVTAMVRERRMRRSRRDR